MTEQDKELLLLKDLSARLPYGVKFSCKDIKGIWTLSGISKSKNGFICFPNFPKLYNVVPCLRSMSSMTEEEYKEMQMVLGRGEYAALMNKTSGLELWLESVDTDPTIWFDSLVDVQDWLNAHHFDYRGLIEKGFALEAPDGMYNFLTF